MSEAVEGSPGYGLLFQSIVGILVNLSGVVLQTIGIPIPLFAVAVRADERSVGVIALESGTGLTRLGVHNSVIMQSTRA